MGTYIEKNSVIHALKPALKILGFIAGLVLTLLVKNPILGCIDIILLLAFTALAKLKITDIVGFLTRLWYFLLIILLVNFLFYSSDTAETGAGLIKMSQEGLIQGLKIDFNVVMILLWANLMMATTSPMALMDGIRVYLSPLRYIKVPVNNLTLILSVAIQFIPILIEEAESIKKAQIARGAAFESKNLLKKAGAVMPLVIPIFVAAFKRADELSQALEARGYQGE